MDKIKIAIIGASYLQEPLIRKAKLRGLETHVFAWKTGDVGEKIADYFYPISIVEKEQILNKCKEIGIKAICSIASDLAMITVNYIAEQMKLVGNSMDCTRISTNKHLMRLAFEKNNDPSPKSFFISDLDGIKAVNMEYPLIVKPVDRSGSRGVTLAKEPIELENAVTKAMAEGFKKNAVIEEYAEGDEYSVESISWKGEHTVLAITKKYTTGAPNFVETAHLEPAGLSEEMVSNVKNVVIKALDSLMIEYGASHSEIKISNNGTIKIIEIGGRMGGDNIGADLVELSTGIDFVNIVLDVALGIEPKINILKDACAAIRYVFSKKDIQVLEEIKKNHPEIIVQYAINEISDRIIDDSSKRLGYYIIQSDNKEIIEGYMP